MNPAKRRVIEEKLCCLFLLLIFIGMFAFGISIIHQSEDNEHDEKLNIYRDHISQWNKVYYQQFNDQIFAMRKNTTHLAYINSNDTKAIHPAAESDLPHYTHLFYSSHIDPVTITNKDFKVDTKNPEHSDFMFQTDLNFVFDQQDITVPNVTVYDRYATGDNQKMCRIQRHGHFDSADRTCYLNRQLAALCLIVEKNQDDKWVLAEKYQEYPCMEPSNKYTATVPSTNFYEYDQVKDASKTNRLEELTLNDVYVEVRSLYDPYVQAVYEGNLYLGPTQAQLFLLGIGMIVVASVSMIAIFIFLFKRKATNDMPFSSLGDTSMAEDRF